MTSGTSEIRRLYLDTCIFIYAFEGTDPQKRRLRRLFRYRPSGPEPFLYTSELALCECLVGAIKSSDYRSEITYENLSYGSAILEVGPVAKEVLFVAARLRAVEGSLKLPDAIHLATAMLFGCSHLLTRDDRLRGNYTLPNERQLSLAGIWKSGFSVDVIGPTYPELTQFLEAPSP